MRVDYSLKSDNPVFDKQVRETPPGMAHWAGTGPSGKSCGDCRYLIPRGALGYGCDLYRQRMGKQPQNEIPRQTRACKYFDPREVVKTYGQRQRANRSRP